MSMQHMLLKNFLKRFDQTSFDVFFETGEEIHVGIDDPKFKMVMGDVWDLTI